MIKHGETERSIIRLFEEASEFIFEQEKYEIISKYVQVKLSYILIL